MTAAKPKTTAGIPRPASVKDLQNLCVFHSLLPHDAQIRLKRAAAKEAAAKAGTKRKINSNRTGTKIQPLQASIDLTKEKYPLFFRNEEKEKNKGKAYTFVKFGC